MRVMRNFLCGVLLVAVTAPVAAESDREKLKEDLVRTEAAFFRHARAQGFNSGLHAFMAPDALIANSLVLGREAQAAKTKAESMRPRATVMRWKPLRAEVAESGDLGYTWGVAEAGPDEAGPFRPYGVYVTIWRRLPDGQWKFVYDAATILAAEAVEKFLREHFPATGESFPAAGAAAPTTSRREKSISPDETAR